MNGSDIAKMAFHNLWQRRWRTLFNLTGIVIGCVMVIMTSAGAIGVQSALHSLFDSSEYARHISIYPFYRFVQGEPPDEYVKVEGSMSSERRERIHEMLKQQWQDEQKNATRPKVTQELLSQIESKPGVTGVAADATISCKLLFEDQGIDSYLEGAPLLRTDLLKRIVVGDSLKQDDVDSILVNEFLAYRLGYRSDKQLNELIGKKISIQYRIDGHQVSQFFSFFNQGLFRKRDVGEQLELLEAIKSLMDNLDASSLNERQKSLIQSLFPNERQLPKNIEDVTKTRTFTVRGIFYNSRDNSGFSFLRNYFRQRGGDLVIDPQLARQIYLENPANRQFYDASIMVKETKHLRAITEMIRKRGFHTVSVLPMLDHIDYEIERISWIIFALAGAVLFIASLGIFNTLVISVLERTQEFGIMKSIGAKDSNILWLMICEGALSGVLGAAIAVAISQVLSYAGQWILEMYVESRIQDDISGQLFSFSAGPIAIAFGLAVMFCVVASIIPAWRAARLDPVVAMRRN